MIGDPYYTDNADVPLLDLFTVPSAPPAPTMMSSTIPPLRQISPLSPLSAMGFTPFFASLGIERPDGGHPVDDLWGLRAPLSPDSSTGGREADDEAVSFKISLKHGQTNEVQPTRRFHLYNPTLPRLHSTISNLYTLKPQTLHGLSWLDEDGDSCVLSHALELQEAVWWSKRSGRPIILRGKVQATTPQPEEEWLVGGMECSNDLDNVCSGNCSRDDLIALLMQTRANLRRLEADNDASSAVYESASEYDSVAGFPYKVVNAEPSEAGTYQGEDDSDEEDDHSSGAESDAVAGPYRAYKAAKAAGTLHKLYRGDDSTVDGDSDSDSESEVDSDDSESVCSSDSSCTSMSSTSSSTSNTSTTSNSSRAPSTNSSQSSVSVFTPDIAALAQIRNKSGFDGLIQVERIELPRLTAIEAPIKAYYSDADATVDSDDEDQHFTDAQGEESCDDDSSRRFRDGTPASGFYLPVTTQDSAALLRELAEREMEEGLLSRSVRRSILYEEGIPWHRSIATQYESDSTSTPTPIKKDVSVTHKGTGVPTFSRVEMIQNSPAKMTRGTTTRTPLLISASTLTDAILPSKCFVCTSTTEKSQTTKTTTSTSTTTTTTNSVVLTSSSGTQVPRTALASTSSQVQTLTFSTASQAQPNHVHTGTQPTPYEGITTSSTQSDRVMRRTIATETGSKASIGTNTYTSTPIPSLARGTTVGVATETNQIRNELFWSYLLSSGWTVPDLLAFSSPSSGSETDELRSPALGVVPMSLSTSSILSRSDLCDYLLATGWTVAAIVDAAAAGPSTKQATTDGSSRVGLNLDFADRESDAFGMLMGEETADDDDEDKTVRGSECDEDEVIEEVIEDSDDEDDEQASEVSEQPHHIEIGEVSEVSDNEDEYENVTLASTSPSSPLPASTTTTTPPSPTSIISDDDDDFVLVDDVMDEEEL
ncbi:hypothetical protein DFS34DRAFT_592483 [Phlyctochytrium arcticum]|nr:hypothetical protein DFS34DRAFT_592483 [Phlyctochytrium arcticum]